MNIIHEFTLPSDPGLSESKAFNLARVHADQYAYAHLEHFEDYEVLNWGSSEQGNEKLWYFYIVQRGLK